MNIFIQITSKKIKKNKKKFGIINKNICEYIKKFPFFYKK